MTSVFDGLDLSDPCALWPRLEQVYYRLLAGEGVVRTRFGDDEVVFRRVDLGRLERKLDALKIECQAKQAGEPRVRRRAFTTGF